MNKTHNKANHRQAKVAFGVWFVYFASLHFTQTKRHFCLPVICGVRCQEEI